MWTTYSASTIVVSRARPISSVTGSSAPAPDRGRSCETGGLLATNSIRGARTALLERIKETGDIFMAWSDRPWILDGAAVRVSMVGFDKGQDKHRELNGSIVSSINSDLTSSLDLTTARRLPENLNLSFMGDTKGGAFDIPPEVALPMIHAPMNPNGRYNLDVVHPWVNGLDVTRRSRGCGLSTLASGRARLIRPFTNSPSNTSCAM